MCTEGFFMQPIGIKELMMKIKRIYIRTLNISQILNYSKRNFALKVNKLEKSKQRMKNNEYSEKVKIQNK